MTLNDLAEMEAEFQKLAGNCNLEINPRDALAIARRYPRTAAISGATATYAIGYRMALDQPIKAKDPMKSGLALKFSKSAGFADFNGLINGYELAFTQTAYEREASLIAMVPLINATLQKMFDSGMKRHEFTLMTEVAVWMAATVSRELMRDVIAIGKAMR